MMQFSKSTIAMTFLSLCFVLLGSGCDDGHGHGDTGDVLELVGDPQMGQVHIDATCALSNCHGSDGDSGPAPDISFVVPEHTDADLAGVIRNGTGLMPAQSTSLDDQAIADVMSRLRELYP